MRWTNFIERVQIITAIFSCLLNILLTFLILKKSPKQLGAYKYLMLYISWFEIAYSILDVIVSPIIYSKGALYMIIVVTKVSTLFSKHALLIIECIWTGFFGTSMGIFALQFVYRYFVAVGSINLKYFKSYRIFLWMLIPVFFGAIWGTTCYFLVSPKTEINDKMRNTILYVFGWNIEKDITYIGPYFFERKPDGSIEIFYDSMIGVMILWAILTTSFIITPYFAIKCYLKLRQGIEKKKSEISRRFGNLQNQIFYALVSQTIIPVILMHIPASL
ncbi:unnamed protein product [Caenorhabditis angaria]|uniref:7TM GPCR serpentine receptor class x (Srx) domain-containing protein n=1 Tax=Caenorhabditis angaria TaxID=860376 RepID=A0A9P1I9F4_9PELO|nr:unnamed protein product [Caenorhabditis angaria]